MPVSVSCSSNDNRTDRRMILRVREMMEDHLTELGLDGSYALRFHKRTGGSLQNRVAFKRALKSDVNAGKAVLEYAVRPFDRDSSWIVHVDPPKPEDIKRIEKIESHSRPEPETDEVEEPTVEEVAVTTLNINQVCKAKIVSHAPHGLNIALPGGNSGFIPLADLCNGKPNRREMFNFPEEKTIKVAIVDPKANPIRCTTRLEGVTSTSHPRDVFSGVPDVDGILDTAGYTYDHKRVYELVEDIAIGAILTHPDVPLQEATLHADEATLLIKNFMIKKFPGTIDVKQHCSLILRFLCSPGDVVQEPLLQKTEAGLIRLTEFGWSELRETLGNNKKKEDFNAEVAEPLGGSVEQELGILGEPSAPIPEPSSEPEEAQDEAAPQDDISMIATYLGKAVRLADLESQIEALIEEKRQLANWIDANQELKTSAQQFHRMLGERSS